MLCQQVIFLKHGKVIINGEPLYDPNNTSCYTVLGEKMVCYLGTIWNSCCFDPQSSRFLFSRDSSSYFHFVFLHTEISSSNMHILIFVINWASLSHYYAQSASMTRKVKWILSKVHVKSIQCEYSFHEHTWSCLIYWIQPSVQQRQYCLLRVGAASDRRRHHLLPGAFNWRCSFIYPEKLSEVSQGEGVTR